MMKNKDKEPPVKLELNEQAMMILGSLLVFGEKSEDELNALLDHAHEMKTDHLLWVCLERGDLAMNPDLDKPHDHWQLKATTPEQKAEILAAKKRGAV